MLRGKMTSKNETHSSESRSGWVIGLVSIVALAVIVVLAMDSGPSDQTSPAASSMPSTSAEASPAANLPPPPRSFPESEIISAERITAEEAMRLVEENQALIIDVRDVRDYMGGHIPGSLQIPLAFVEGEIPWFPTDRKLITYCT